MGYSIDGQQQSQTGLDTVGSPEVIDGSLTGVDVQDGSIAPIDLDRDYVEVAGDTMTGNLDLGLNSLLLSDVSITRSAANVATLGIGDYLRMPEAPVDPDDLVNKFYADNLSSGDFLPLAGGTMEGNITMDGYNILDAADVNAAALQSLTNIGFVNGQLRSNLNKGQLALGGGIVGPDWKLDWVANNVASLAANDFLRVQEDPVDNNDVVRKSYADGLVSSLGTMASESKDDYVEITGDQMTGDLNMDSNELQFGTGGTPDINISRLIADTLTFAHANVYRMGYLRVHKTDSNDPFTVFNSTSDSSQRFAVRNDGALLFKSGATTFAQIQRNGDGLTISHGSGGTPFLQAPEFYANDKINIGVTSNSDATPNISLIGDTTTPSIELGDGTAAVDWTLTRTAANIAALGAGDKLQQNEAPTVGDDLTNKTYVDAAGLVKVQQYITATGVTALGAAAQTVVFNNTGGAATLTLPASPSGGRRIDVSRRASGGSNTVTVDGNGKNINGVATEVLNSQYESLTLEFSTDMNEWMIL